MPSFINPFPKSAYLRLLEYQRRIKPHAMHPDLPLVLFITLSRGASGLALTNPFFPSSVIWIGITLAGMISATIASIVHISVPSRFLTMVRNNRSYLVWEIRLAGTLTVVLGFQLISSLGFLQVFKTTLSWSNFILALFFLISTGWAYRFDSHPAWNTSIIPFYYTASAIMMGLVLRSLDTPSKMLPLIYAILLVAEGLLLMLYQKHLKVTTSTTLKEMMMGDGKWTFLTFLWSTYILPGLLTAILLLRGENEILLVFLNISCLTGILLERILFFRVERPSYFLSFIENSTGKGRHWIRG